MQENVATKTQAIKRFLESKTHSDLANLYSEGMEVQVNVAQDDGERTSGEYRSKKWEGFKDGLTVWKAFRIPYGAGTDNPSYEDKIMTFSLDDHAESIGLTGWDWINRCSRWVGFDFDSLTGHYKGLSDEELKEIFQKVKDIPWITVRTSTSGKGFHLYVMLPNVPTSNHNEHSALARAILDEMCLVTSFDLRSKIDCCGGNMWVWHRKMPSNGKGLRLEKEGGVLEKIPLNWRDHIEVSTRQRKTAKVGFLSTEDEKTFNELVGQRIRVRLTKEHKRVIDYLTETKSAYAWYQDYNMVITHTSHLVACHNDLNLKGIFRTKAEGKDEADHNCFMFPLKDGSWGVRRYSKGVEEVGTWEQDGTGWTRCFFNRECDFGISCKSAGGMEDEKGDYVFTSLEDAEKAAILLGLSLRASEHLKQEKTIFHLQKGGKKLTVKIRYIKEKQENYAPLLSDMTSWILDKKFWVKIFTLKNLANTEADVGNYDDTIRHIITEMGTDNGWTLFTNSRWVSEPLTHVRPALKSIGVNTGDIENIVGTCIFKSWILVNKPFQQEYPGGREWNRDSAQLKYKPKASFDSLRYNSWMNLLNHCGEGLNDILKTNAWAVNAGIRTGGDYLKCWIASLFQFPTKPLPYLFLYGQENSGKSILHEAISLLLTKGYVNAKSAVISGGNFCGELLGSILCYIEEVNLSENKEAYARIKEWVTGKTLMIHEKRKTPYQAPNTTHWIQCANHIEFCPVFSGDTRITFLNVSTLPMSQMIPKERLLHTLKDEARDFITEIMNLELPKVTDRLNIPVINTEEKVALGDSRLPPIKIFVNNNCYPVKGQHILLSDLYEAFLNSDLMQTEDVRKFTKRSVAQMMSREFPHYTKGRLKENNKVAFANVSFKEDSPILPKLTLVGEVLLKEGTTTDRRDS